MGDLHIAAIRQAVVPSRELVDGQTTQWFLTFRGQEPWTICHLEFFFQVFFKRKNKVYAWSPSRTSTQKIFSKHLESWFTKTYVFLDFVAPTKYCGLNSSFNSWHDCTKPDYNLSFNQYCGKCIVVSSKLLFSITYLLV